MGHARDSDDVRGKGFVRLALKTGATLVPVFAFGENDIFDQVENPEGGVLRAFQKRVKSLIGITPPAFYGRSLSRGVFETIFRQTRRLAEAPIDEVVFGKPLEIKKPYGSDQIRGYRGQVSQGIRPAAEKLVRVAPQIVPPNETNGLVRRFRVSAKEDAADTVQIEDLTNRRRKEKKEREREQCTHSNTTRLEISFGLNNKRHIHLHTHAHAHTYIYTHTHTHTERERERVKRQRLL